MIQGSCISLLIISTTHGNRKPVARVEAPAIKWIENCLDDVTIVDEVGPFFLEDFLHCFSRPVMPVPVYLGVEWV